MTEGPRFPPEPSGGPIGANPSFVDLVRRSRPETLPAATGITPDVAAPHGTTVVALKFASGVVFGGDRRATEGFTIADEKMEKVFAADDLSVIAIAGAAGQAIEIVKLFQLELEHYEKITGRPALARGQGEPARADDPREPADGDPGARRGAAVRRVRRAARRGPDLLLRRHRRPVGEDDYHSTGSGGRPARSSLKKRWRPGSIGTRP
jgi:proteasome beta subunit